MKRSDPTRLFARLIVLCTVLGLIDLTGHAQVPQKSVLSLLAAGRDDAGIAVVDTTLHRVIREGLDGNLDYYSEFMDVARFADPDYLEAVQAFFRSKYGGRRFDVITATGDAEFDFVSKYRDVLFPGTPVVFSTAAPVKAFSNSTGVLIPLNIGQTLDMALRIQPDTERVALVVGASAFDKYYETVAREQFRPFEGRLAFTYLTGLPVRDLLRQVAELPPQSIVFYVSFAEDGEGRKFWPTEILDSVSAAANAPTYFWLATGMDHGIVGGRMVSSEAGATRMADLAVRILRGERADAIPVVEADWSTTVFDWRQLRRWNISESRLPANSTILFRQPGAWELYRSYILGGALIVILQSALIAGLIVQRARRRRTELALRQSYEQNRDLAGRLISAQEEERTRIARDLHDDVSQQIAGMGIMLSGLRRKVARSGAEPDVDQAFTTLQDRTSSLAEGIRNLSHELHPSVLQHAGLVATLRRHCADVEQHHHVAVRFSVEGDCDSLSPEVTLCLFRVTQEALANAVRHARARTISVQLVATNEAVELRISDDGIGFVAGEGTGSGLGLRSIDERVRLTLGSVTVESQPGQGTNLLVRVPLPTPQVELA